MTARRRTADAVRAAANARRKPRDQRYEQRSSCGIIVCGIEVDVTIIDLLIKTGWLDPGTPHHGRPEIADAIGGLLHPEQDFLTRQGARLARAQAGTTAP